MEYTLHNGDLTVRLNAKGAELQSISYRGREYLWQGDPTVWPERSPLLFPFVGRLTDEQYTLHQTPYPLRIHGFAKESNFTVTDLDETCITFELVDTEETYQVYPYHFVLQVHYALSAASIAVSYRVRNHSDTTMYFGIGGHPGFQVPLEEGLTFEDYRLRFDTVHVPTQVGFTDRCYLSGSDAPYRLIDGRDLPLRHDLFDHDAIVLKDVSTCVELGSDRGSRSVTVSFPDLAYVGFWHMPHMEVPYVCIEPWSSLPSRQDIVEELSQKSDLIRLRSGDTYRTTWTISLT